VPGAVAAARNGAPARAAEAAAEILKEHGQPMSIGELYSAVRLQGVAVPGKGAQVNLIAAVRSHPDIARPSRGVYAYAPGGGQAGAGEPRPTAKRRRRGAVRGRGPRARTTRVRTTK
jgi:hypothetical protein